ncbi:ATP-binding protein [[Actinomadura] parvosata]|uniref:ATP-binding protein n=1 Tax=[Actinomadura] parvosata TaxID=1955412 RepID=UPI001FE87F46
MTTWVRAEDPSAVGAVRRKAVELAEAAGFDQVLIGQTAVAVSEAVSNLVKHAMEGTVIVRPHPESAATVELITVDRGPGMADVARALRDGYSTSGTLASAWARSPASPPATTCTRCRARARCWPCTSPAARPRRHCAPAA